MSDRLKLEELEFLTAFADYARERGDEAYAFCDPGNCALCQFLRDRRGVKEPRVNPDFWRDGLFSDDETPLLPGLNAALNGGSWTFSALAERLDALIPARVGRG